MFGFIEFDPPTVAALACTAAGLTFAIRGLKRSDHGTPWISSLVWGVLDTLILVGALESAGRANGQLVGGTIGYWVLFGYGLKYGPPGWTRHDRLCLLGAGLGLLARWASGSAAVMVGTPSPSCWSGPCQRSLQPGNTQTSTTGRRGSASRSPASPSSSRFPTTASSPWPHRRCSALSTWRC